MNVIVHNVVHTLFCSVVPGILFLTSLTDVPSLCPGSPDSNYEAMTSRWPSVWVKISSSWICVALYVWTLVAPLVLVNRDFE